MAGLGQDRFSDLYPSDSGMTNEEWAVYEEEARRRSLEEAQAGGRLRMPLEGWAGLLLLALALLWRPGRR